MKGGSENDIRRKVLKEKAMEKAAAIIYYLKKLKFNSYHLWIYGQIDAARKRECVCDLSE